MRFQISMPACAQRVFAEVRFSAGRDSKFPRRRKVFQAAAADRHDAAFDGNACLRPRIARKAQELPATRRIGRGSADTAFLPRWYFASIAIQGFAQSARYCSRSSSSNSTGFQRRPVE
jgi:hypothetical protein